MSVAFSDYRVINEIYSNERISVYRGFRIKDEKSVILKVLKSDFDQDDISHLKHEYILLQRLNLEGVIHAYDLEKQNGHYTLVLEDMTDGITLADFIKNTKLTIEEFLFLGINIAQALFELHLAHIVHKDINPNNIIVSTDGRNIKLIDLSIATLSLEAACPC